MDVVAAGDVGEGFAPVAAAKRRVALVGGRELFRVSTLDFANLPRTPEGKVDFAQDFFGREAFLTVSGQLNFERAAWR